MLIGANATVLGNIQVGDGAQIAAGSLVLKPVRPRTMVAGSPAKEVGDVKGNPAQTMDHSHLNAVSGDSYSLSNGGKKGASATPNATSSVTASMIDGIASSAPSIEEDAQVQVARAAAAAARAAAQPVKGSGSRESQPISRPLRGSTPRSPPPPTPSLLDRVPPAEPLQPGEGI